MYRQHKVEQSKNSSARKPDGSQKPACADELPWIQALDKVEAMELWDGEKREQRSPWKEYLQKADDIMRKPRKPIPVVRTSYNTYSVYK